ncbi:MAG: hypothetical protein EA397_12400 [Deltaproteobacteria bacterium]|nr:MAG: hypothetical protein EA397_12400 [Deltaproteobacteria bacterium]
MIIVTGTKRSGTSMWMQMLEAAGFPWIGAPYMGAWEKSIKGANPKGFYESTLRAGIFFATNPDPKTGNFLHPKSTKRHAVKVFIPGLIRTDYAYIDRVIITMRPWREYQASLNRLFQMEDEYRENLPEEEQKKAKREVGRRRQRIPPEVEWWFDHYELIRDLATRRYPVHLTTYHRVLADPEPELKQVLEWLGGGDVAKAAAVVEPKLNTQKLKPHAEIPHQLDLELIEVMDDLYDRAHHRRGLDAALIDKMNEWQKRMEERWGAPSRDRSREDIDAPDVDKGADPEETSGSSGAADA